MATVERRLQGCLNEQQKWCDENGFKFSDTKRVCVHFTQRREVIPAPSLTLNNQQIHVKEEAKFLGLIFDRKLSFIPHLNI